MIDDQQVREKERQAESGEGQGWVRDAGRDKSGDEGGEGGR